MGLSLAAVLGASTAFAATNTLTPYQPRWGSAYQSRTAGRVATFDAARTNAYDAAVATRSGQPRPAVVAAEAGPNHRSWRAQTEPVPSGPSNRAGSMRVAENSRVVELGSGMHYWDGQQWSPSDASFDLTEDAFVANRVQHRTRLNADLNVIGAVTTTLRDGNTLRSTPVAIALYDPNDGRFAVVSVITNTPGVLVANNRVLFADAFRGGVCADIVYTIQKGSFEQDVVITGRFNPRDYGFPTNSQIQIITEFYDPPQPERLRRPIYVERNELIRRRMVSPDLVDEVLGFSELVIGTGRAYTPPSAVHTNGTQTVVAKEFRTFREEGRTFLIETVNCLSIQKALNALPECPQESRTARIIHDSIARDGLASIPRAGAPAQAKAKPSRASTLLARAESPVRSGVAIDYVEEIDDPITAPKVFQGDTTYLIAAPVYCNGLVTIEGGAVIKYTAGASIKLNSAVTCKT